MERVILLFVPFGLKLWLLCQLKSCHLLNALLLLSFFFFFFFFFPVCHLRVAWDVEIDKVVFCSVLTYSGKNENLIADILTKVFQK